MPDSPSRRGSANGQRLLRESATQRSSPECVATYAQRIEKKSARKSAPRPAVKAPPTAATKAEPAAAPPAGTPSIPSGELQRLKDDLQRINREISKIARESRGGRDAARHSQLPEKQQLLAQRQDLERKIRTLT